MALIFAACSANLPVVSTPQPASVLTATGTARPSSSPTSRLTMTIQPTKTVTKRPSATPIPPSPTPRFNVSGQKIEDVDNGHWVETARWSDDGKFIYYGFHVVDGKNEELQWVTYDVATHLTKTIQSPLNYDADVWKRLAIPTPRPIGVSVELKGNVSPSGKRIIYTVGYGGSGPYSTPEPDVRPRTEIWVADSNGKHKTKLKEFPGLGSGVILQAVWLKNETKVLPESTGKPSGLS